MIVWISIKIRWLVIYIYPRARISRPRSSLGIGPAITWLHAAIVPVVHCSADAILELQTNLLVVIWYCVHTMASWDTAAVHVLIRYSTLCVCANIAQYHYGDHVTLIGCSIYLNGSLKCKLPIVIETGVVFGTEVRLTTVSFPGFREGSVWVWSKIDYTLLPMLFRRSEIKTRLQHVLYSPAVQATPFSVPESPLGSEQRRRYSNISNNWLPCTLHKRFTPPPTLPGTFQLLCAQRNEKYFPYQGKAEAKMRAMQRTQIVPPVNAAQQVWFTYQTHWNYVTE